LLFYLLTYYIWLERPDGGSGGKGGDVYFKASEKMTSLYDLRRAHFLGNNGKGGKVSK
jgi:GTP-binding protein